MAPELSPAERPRSFALPAWYGEVAPGLELPELAAEVRRVADPAAALRTLHWGRNYLYLAELATTTGARPVVVKQFRHDGWRARLERRWKGSKAERSWRAALALAAAGVPTPEPLLLLESTRPEGPAAYVCAHLDGVFEARYFFRALAAGRALEEFPGVTVEALLDAIAALARALHAAQVWHRDLSIGNLLVAPGPTPESAPALWLLDLNRCRLGRALTTSERTRDLCRLPIPDGPPVERFLAAYWGDERAARDRRGRLYRLYAASFRARQRAKPALRRGRERLRGLLFSRTVHPHIAPPPPGAKVEDRAVWDDLSDQPHLHAGRVGRATVRLRQLPDHLAAAGVAALALARAWPRARQRERAAFTRPAPLDGVGVALRPWPTDRDGLLAALDELGATKVLLRLHPWQDEHDEEERLARELHARGLDLTFALPQSRELVRDPARWRSAVAALGERFRPYGQRFQIGQAINRSKWGIWTTREAIALAASAAEELRRLGEVELLGPAVIDFEPHALAAALELGGPSFRFDIVSALLYVDRRGAPENRQLGLDTVGKLALWREIGAAARRGADRLWITEVNWPLREGPHSPAGKAVSVDEATQADYLTRYLLLALGSGLAERVYWWQLVAKGYGLVDPAGLRRRPSFHALQTLATLFAGATCEGAIAVPRPARLLHLRLADGTTAFGGWSQAEPVEVNLPAPARRLLTSRGEELPAPSGPSVILDATPRYFLGG